MALPIRRCSRLAIHDLESERGILLFLRSLPRDYGHVGVLFGPRD